MQLRPVRKIWIYHVRYGDRTRRMQGWQGLSDREFVMRQFRAVYGRDPDLASPAIFDEKIQWYKLNYRRPLMTDLTDKFKVRNYVEERGLGHLLNELHGVYDRPEEIPFADLPTRFVLKANHGCKWNIICKNKPELDWEAAKRQLAEWLEMNYFDYGREWAYKDIQPRIICERYLENAEFGELVDYKFYCYDGVPKVVFVCCGRFSPGGVRYDAYDMDWEPIPVSKGKPAARLDLARPSEFNEMRDIAHTLSEGFPFLRVDLYSVEGRIYFGELTFYPDNGIVPFSPAQFNRYFGDLFKLPEGPVPGESDPTSSSREARP